MSNVCQPFAYSSYYLSGTANDNMIGYSDADFANSVDDRRSLTGYVFLLADAPLSGARLLNTRLPCKLSNRLC